MPFLFVNEVLLIYIFTMPFNSNYFFSPIPPAASPKEVGDAEAAVSEGAAAASSSGEVQPAKKKHRTAGMLAKRTYNRKPKALAVPAAASASAFASDSSSSSATGSSSRALASPRSPRSPSASGKSKLKAPVPSSSGHPVKTWKQPTLPGYGGLDATDNVPLPVGKRGRSNLVDSSKQFPALKSKKRRVSPVEQKEVFVLKCFPCVVNMVVCMCVCYDWYRSV
jgi:hypothetical protein